LVSARGRETAGAGPVQGFGEGLVVVVEEGEGFVFQIRLAGEAAWANDTSGEYSENNVDLIQL
jgi:hypothetical protein